MNITAAQWRPADGLTLEPNALKAVKETLENLVLTAGPGAGKTEMLAQRADFLLRTGMCPYPRRILAISFKIDANRNLKDRVHRRCGRALSSRFDSHTFHAFAKRLIDRFRPALSAENALDPDYTVGDQRFGHSQITFGDLVPFALEILDTCEVARNAVRQTYTHVFLDEFQDCTNNQFALIRAAFAGTGIRLTAVGDVKQRIMGSVPGAVEGIFATFAKEFGTGSLNLYQNFRSQPRLRRMQNAMVKVLEPAAALDDEAIQGNGGDIEVLPFDDSQQEADAVADLISNWIRDEQVPPSEIAVLISKQPEHYGELLMEELRKRQIAFRNEQKLQDLSVEPIARFIVDFLLVVRGDREPDAYGRLIGGAPWSDSEEEREVNLQGFLDEIRRDYGNHVALNRSAVRPLVDRLLETVGAQKVAALSAEYEQGDYLKKKIDETLIRINELWTKGSDVRETLAKFSEDSAVRIMTIHKSKGLEFDSVVVLGVEQEAFFGKIVDERAAFFVAISRAKRRLKLTWAKERARPSGNPYRWHTKRTPQAEFLGYSDGI